MSSDSYLRVAASASTARWTHADGECIEPSWRPDTRRGVRLHRATITRPLHRWDMGFVIRRSRSSPAAAGSSPRREPARLVLLPAVARRSSISIRSKASSGRTPGRGHGARADSRFTEEDRRSIVVLSARTLIELFGHAGSRTSALRAFGYDLAFQFEPIHPRLCVRPPTRSRALLPDELIVVDTGGRWPDRRRYDFEAWAAAPPRACPARRHHGLRGRRFGAPRGDTDPARMPRSSTRLARPSSARSLRVGPRQTFFEPSSSPPSELFRRLRERNPAPYFPMNLGDAEYLVGASPEMYVRCGRRPRGDLSDLGTIARGRDPSPTRPRSSAAQLGQGRVGAHDFT